MRSLCALTVRGCSNARVLRMEGEGNGAILQAAAGSGETRPITICRCKHHTVSAVWMTPGLYVKRFWHATFKICDDSWNDLKYERISVFWGRSELSLFPQQPHRDNGSSETGYSDSGCVCVFLSPSNKGYLKVGHNHPLTHYLNSLFFNNPTIRRYIVWATDSVVKQITDKSCKDTLIAFVWDFFADWLTGWLADWCMSLASHCHLVFNLSEMLLLHSVEDSPVLILLCQNVLKHLS
jgi:hypothetical protein